MKRVYSFRALGVGVATKIRFDSVGGERTSPRVLLPAVRLAAGRRAAGSGSAAASGSAGGGARQVGFDRAGGFRNGPRGGWCESRNVSRAFARSAGVFAPLVQERDGWMSPSSVGAGAWRARAGAVSVSRGLGRGNARAGESSNGGRRRTERLAVSFARSHRPRRPLGVGWDGARGGFVAARPRGPIAHRSPLGAVSPGVCRAEARHRRASSPPDSEVTSSDDLFRRAPRAQKIYNWVVGAVVFAPRHSFARARSTWTWRWPATPRPKPSAEAAAGRRFPSTSRCACAPRARRGTRTCGTPS